MRDAVTHKLCDGDPLKDFDDVSVIELEPLRLGEDELLCDGDKQAVTLPLIDTDGE